MPKTTPWSVGRSTLLALWAVSASCATQSASQPPQQAQLAQAIAAPDRPGPPEPLAPAAKVLLKERMAAHARDMGELVSAIMLLEYDGIAARADKIASDVNLSRPTTSDATQLNAQIPEKFFVRQDDLRAAAHNLADAARSRNPYKVADAYGRVSETCVRCHADFRPTLPDAPPEAAR
ncbi:MAG TPA: cytochrome c [Polyangia bacterium]|nr:cytochrome c [Polyangia bacterium]